MPTDDPLVWLRKEYNDDTALLAKTFGNGCLGVSPDVLAALIDVAEHVECSCAVEKPCRRCALDATIRKEMKT